MSTERTPVFHLRALVLVAALAGGVGWYIGYGKGIEGCPARQERIRDREKSALEYLRSAREAPSSGTAVCDDRAGEEWRENLLDQECLDYCAQYYETPDPYPRSRTDF